MSAAVLPRKIPISTISGPSARASRRPFTLTLLSDKDAATGLVRIPVTISYNALDGTPVAQQTGIDIMMKGKCRTRFCLG